MHASWSQIASRLKQIDNMRQAPGCLPVSPRSRGGMAATAVAISWVTVLLLGTWAAGQAPNGGASQPTPSPRQLKVYPPFPNSTDSADILANVLWGLERSDMDRVLEQALREGRASPMRILDVESGYGRQADYYLLEFDTPARRPSWTVKIGKDGWLHAVGRYDGIRPRYPVPDLTVVAQQLKQRYGAVNAHYYHVYGTLEGGGGSEFVPLIKAETPDGMVLINSRGEVFRQLTLESTEGLSPEAADADLQRRRRAGQRMLLFGFATGTYEKIDTLPTVR